MFIQPEAHDVLAYDRNFGELRMHACTKGERDIYRRKFGLHLFGREDFFPGTAKYTLDPLRTAGARSLVCNDVDGMEWVRPKQIDLYWGGAESQSESRECSMVLFEGDALHPNPRALHAGSASLGRPRERAPDDDDSYTGAWSRVP